MKTFKILLWFIALCVFFSCAKNLHLPEIIEDETTGEALSHEQIILGAKLSDPYSIENVTKALESLYPTKANRVDIHPTDIYVRFLPAGEKEYDRLAGMGLVLMDHPLDYQIIRDGDYYHDPSLPEGKITWQYCVVPKDFEFPNDIPYEILDHCYIAENTSPTKADSWIDWDAVEEEAYRLTGNEELYVPGTKGGKTKPKGRITIVDDKLDGGKPFGVAGVKVVCNSFVKFSSAYTNRDGYYSIPKAYSSKVRYRLLFKNEKNFAIGVNLILIPASTSALGKASPSGLDVIVTKESERKLFTRCAVNNAAYDYISRCAPEDLNLPLPPANLRIWILQKFSSSSTVMLRHGTLLDNALVQKYLGKYALLLALFLPDITIGLKDENDYAGIYSTVCHEMAHASHFSRVGKTYWNRYMTYVITSFVTSGGQVYGSGNETFAGYCEVGEMWGYFMENLLYHERYGGAMPKAGMSYWFKPQIFKYMNERGMSASKIMGAMTPDVTDKLSLRNRLISMYPENSAMIDMVFRRYSE